MSSQNKPLVRNFLIMLVCFIIDSTLAYFLPLNLDKSSITIVPSIALMMFVPLSMTLADVPSRFFFATVSGVFYTLVYGRELSIYVLIFLGITFIRSYIYHSDNLSLGEFIFLCLLAIAAKETIVYVMMLSANITHMAIFTFALKRLLPTIGFNILLSPIVYIVFKSFHIKVDINPYDDIES